MIDTHCHLTYKGLSAQMAAVVKRASEAGVDRMITIGLTPDDGQQAVAAAARFGQVYAAVGVHPHYADRFVERDQLVAALRELAAQPKVVAIGEMGLDAHYPDPPMADQQRVLQWQLELAGELPPRAIIIHNREATSDTLAMLRASGIDGRRFVFHCFTGDRGELAAVLEFGAMVGYTGIVTFKNATEISDCAAHTPIDRLLIETDSPYCTPQPHRKVRPNEPCYVPHVAKFIAQLRGMTTEELVGHVDANAERFFGLASGDTD